MTGFRTRTANIFLQGIREALATGAEAIDIGQPHKPIGASPKPLRRLLMSETIPFTPAHQIVHKKVHSVAFARSWLYREERASTFGLRGPPPPIPNTSGSSLEPLRRAPVLLGHHGHRQPRVEVLVVVVVLQVRRVRQDLLLGEHVAIANGVETGRRRGRGEQRRAGALYSGGRAAAAVHAELLGGGASTTAVVVLVHEHRLQVPLQVLERGARRRRSHRRRSTCPCSQPTLLLSRLPSFAGTACGGRKESIRVRWVRRIPAPRQ